MPTELQLAARRAIPLLDLTSLNDDDTVESIDSLCVRAISPEGQVAAVCVNPQFVLAAQEALRVRDLTEVRVATVANFPEGDADLLAAYNEVLRCVEAGVDEVDLVFPWRSLMAGDWMVGQELVQASVRACENKAALKVIIESGQLASPALIRQASELCIDAGANFIKTSTGKTPVGATPAAVQVIVEVLRESVSRCGLKISGGVSCAEQAHDYLKIVDEVMGDQWATASTLRFGASTLLGSLQSVINEVAD